MTDSDPALIDLDTTRQAHERMYDALSQTSATSPEARALRSAVANCSRALTHRTTTAEDSNMTAREIQFLADLQHAANVLLRDSVLRARSTTDLTWQDLGNLLGMSRQAAWERYQR